MEVALRTSGDYGTELQSTPTENTVEFRAADFSTLCEALDYAALGQTGSNFYGSRANCLPSCHMRIFESRHYRWRESF